MSTVTSALKSLRPVHWVGLGMLAAVVAFVVVFPLTPVYHPYTQDLTAQLLPPLSHGHVLGTDSLGRDTASRLALAGRVTLLIAILIIAANAVIGMLVGTLSGYFGGKLDNALMAVADIQLAMPVILVLTALAATFGPGVYLMVIVLALTFWVGYARVARTAARQLRERDFVLAAKLQGVSLGRIMRVHVLPGVATQMLILATTDLGTVILLMSSFDYLGLGVQAPTPSWGSMISDGQKYLRESAWQGLVPGITIFLVVAGMNLFSQRFTSEQRGLHLRPARLRKLRRAS